MTIAQILALLGPFLPAIEQELQNLDTSEVQPWIKAEIAKAPTAVQPFLTALDAAFDAAAQAAIAKI